MAGTSACIPQREAMKLSSFVPALIRKALQRTAIAIPYSLMESPGSSFIVKNSSELVKYSMLTTKMSTQTKDFLTGDNVRS